MTNTPHPDYQESLQLLRYNNGQYYNRHHDYIEHHEHRAQGPRILTFFLYLSDVEEGGGTNFPVLNITVQPKRGKALLWPSTFNDAPMKKDARTDHAAMPVIKGQKYAANAWIHQYDFQTPHKKGCT